LILFCTLWCVIETKRHNMPPSVHYIPRACIIRHKIFVWVASRCVWPSPDASWSGNWAVREQRSSTHCWLVLPFLVPSISHALWIWNSGNFIHMMLSGIDPQPTSNLSAPWVWPEWKPPATMNRCAGNASVPHANDG
jgi:hypothetical protein